MPKSSKAAVAPTSKPSPARGKAASKGAAAPRSAARSGARAASSGRSSTTSAKARSKAAPAKQAKGSKGGATSPDRFFEEQRSLLLAEREASLRQAESLRAEAAQLAEEMEPGDTQFDEESGEGGTLNVERERDLALSAQALSAVEEIDRALAKLDAGSYGTCEGCGQPIPKARLKALPYATLCVGCKSGGLSRR
ncbi:MAG TPA: TraR/DksA C4-type zinc finger protein [Acidimicrobiales bacterium]|nr:TraR/DksA C4-type zinc finger protein [Acidimicrobiales bacterium]